MRNIGYRSGVIFALICFFSSCSSRPVKKRPPVKKEEITISLVNFLKTGRILKGVAFSTSGGGAKEVMVAVFDIPGNVFIYSLPDLTLRKKIPAGVAPVLELGFLNRSADLVVLYGNDTARLYPVSGASSPRTLPLSKNAGPLRSLATEPEGRRVAFGNSRGEFWISDTELTAFVSHKVALKAVNYIRFSPDGKRLLLAGGRDCLVVAGESGKTENRITLESPPVSFAFTPDGKYLIAGTLFWRAHCLEMDSLKRQGVFEIDMDPVSSLVYHPSKKWLILGSGKTGRGTMHLLSLPELKLLKKTPLSMEEVIGVGSIGSEFVIVSSDGTIQVLR